MTSDARRPPNPNILSAQPSTAGSNLHQQVSKPPSRHLTAPLNAKHRQPASQPASHPGPSPLLGRPKRGQGQVRAEQLLTHRHRWDSPPIMARPDYDELGTR